MSRRLSQIVDREVRAYFRNKSMLFLDAAIATLLECHSGREVVEILRKQAELLEEHG